MGEITKVTLVQGKLSTSPPVLIYVLAADDPKHRLKSVPLSKARTWSDFASTIAHLYALTPQHTISASLDGSLIDPLLWPHYLVNEETYMIRIEACVDVKIVVLEGFEGYLAGSGGKRVKTSGAGSTSGSTASKSPTASCVGASATLETVLVSHTVWELRFRVLRALRDEGWRGMPVEKEDVRWCWRVDGAVGGAGGVTPQKSSARKAKEKEKNTARKSGEGVGALVEEKGEKEKEGVEEVVRVTGLEEKTTIREIMEALRVKPGVCEGLVVEVGGVVGKGV